MNLYYIEFNTKSSAIACCYVIPHLQVFCRCLCCYWLAAAAAVVVVVVVVVIVAVVYNSSNNDDTY